MPTLRPRPYNDRVFREINDSEKTSFLDSLVQKLPPVDFQEREEEKRCRVRLNKLKRENRVLARSGSQVRKERLTLIKFLVDVTYPAVFSDYSLESACEYKPGLVKRGREQYEKMRQTFARKKEAKLAARAEYEKAFGVAEKQKKPQINVAELRKAAQRENSASFQQSQERLKKWRSSF